MKKSLTLILSISLVLSSCVDKVIQQTPDYLKLENEVREVFSNSIQLFEDKDLDGLVNRFTKDASLKLPGAPLIKGHDALRENYAGTISLENFSISLDVTQVVIAECGDMAWAQAAFEVSFITPGGPFKDQGVTLMTLTRENDMWKIVSENLSSGPSVD